MQFGFVSSLLSRSSKTLTWKKERKNNVFNSGVIHERGRRGDEKNEKRGEQRILRPVSDYSMPNVSDKVVRIIVSYTDYINRVVWSK